MAAAGARPWDAAARAQASWNGPMKPGVEGARIARLVVAIDKTAITGSRASPSAGRTNANIPASNVQATKLAATTETVQRGSRSADAPFTTCVVNASKRACHLGPAGRERRETTESKTPGVRTAGAARASAI